MMESMSLKIAATLKKLMERNHFSLADISKETGVPKSTISDWLSNRSPNPVQAVKVAKFFEVSLHYLLFGEEDTEEPLTKLIKQDVFTGTFEINIKRINIKE